jgi:hypothetical protein
LEKPTMADYIPGAGYPLGLLFKTNLQQHPEVFTIPDDIAVIIEKQQAVRRAAEEKVNPPKPEPARVELNRLRSQLFALQQTAKATEQKVNNEAGNVSGLEQRINEAIKTKNGYETAGNLLATRNTEHGIQLLEDELSDARDRLTKDQRWNAGAVRELRTWQTENGPRLKELEKEVASIPAFDWDSIRQRVARSFRP